MTVLQLCVSLALAQTGHTTVAIDGAHWLVNGQPTNTGSPAEGLLMNVRMVNSTYEDLRPGIDFDAEANTDRFLAQIDKYQAQGVNAFTLCLQGGSPIKVKGDGKHREVVNTAFQADGSVRPEYLSRVERVLRACDDRGLVVILGLFYEGQSARLADAEAVRRGVVEAVKWLKATGLRNVVLEIANEHPHSGFRHEIIRSFAGMAGLIRLAKETWPELLVSASGLGSGTLSDEVYKASDFALIHFNNTPVEQIPERLAAFAGHLKPIVCNEDDKSGPDAAAALRHCVEAGVGYGLMLNTLNQYLPFEWHGADDDPIFYAELKRLTGANRAGEQQTYYPPSESQGGWRRLADPEDIRRLAGMDPNKLAELAGWLHRSDERKFAAAIVRHGWLVLLEERGNSASTDVGWVKSVSKAICATALAIASERGKNGLGARAMTFDDLAFDFLPWAQPLSDPRKARITVRQLLNHTSGLSPESTGVPGYGTWEFVLGHSGDQRTARLAFDPGTACGYSTIAYDHAALLCESVTGERYEPYLKKVLLEPLGIEHSWFQTMDGTATGVHESGSIGLPALDLARIGYCLAQGGRWADEQVVPAWFVSQTALPSHTVTTPELRWGLNPAYFTLGWELPSKLTGASGRDGRGIPADLRSKFGSGGQCLAWCPSLDLVITRQTGDAGEWAYEEFLRLAVAACL